MKSIQLSKPNGAKSAALGCLLIIQLAVVVTESQAALGFDPLNGIIVDTLVVSVTIDASVSDLHGFSMVLEFDPSIVIPIAVSAGDLIDGAVCPNFLSWLNATAIGDSIAVDGATLGCAVAGPGDIIDITFLGVGFGISPLECRRSELRNSLNVGIPHTCPDGTISRTLIGLESKPWAAVKRLYR